MKLFETQLIRHDSAAGEWELARREPHPLLRPYVAGYCGYVERRVSFSRRLEVPGRIAVAIINLGPSYRVLGPGNRSGPADYGSFAAGLTDRHVIVEAVAPAHGLQVDFTPIGAYLFFGMPMRELTNRTLALEDVLGPEAGRIAAQVEDTPGWPARFDAVDAFIMRRIAAARASSPVVASAWQRLARSAGRLRIDTLADDAGWSRKHLAARFHEEVGLPPKTMARILRFNAVRERLASDGGARLAEVAHASGYYDQAHFNRDFREFAGMTPGEYLARQLPDGAGTLAQ